MAKKTITKTSLEIKVGKVTFLSQDKGAFVELIQRSSELSQKEEIFVPRELLKGSIHLAKDQLVQLEKEGDKIVNITPF